MKKDSLGFIGNSIDKTLNKIYLRKQPPIWLYVVILLIYGLNSYFTARVARSEIVLSLFGNPVPLPAFTGVFSLTGNIAIIFLVLFYRKLGFITAVVLHCA